MNGHTAEKCRQNLLCIRCNRKGHLVDKCYARNKISPTLMTLSGNQHDIIKWTAKLNGREVEVALDSCAQTSVISTSLAKKL